MIQELLGARGLAWCTFFGAMVLQGLPFVALGVTLSTLVNVLTPARLLQALVGRRSAIGLPVAAVCGMGLPGCECSAVPVADRLAQRGVPFANAMAFAMASPAINPVVLVATATAFPGEPRVVLARFLASLLTVVTVATVLRRRSIDRAGAGGHDHQDHGPLIARLVGTARHDLLHTIAYLVIGAAAVATLKIVVPPGWSDGLVANLWIAILAGMLLAVLMAVCSEADAFVAASLVGFPLVAKLGFMVIGPIVDIRLIALYRGAFGNRVAATVVTTATAAALVTTVVIGGVLL